MSASTRSSVEQKTTIAAIAAGFAGLLSLFNIGGRFFWASLSDYIGRKNTYYTFFILGIALYALAPTFAAMGSKLLFVLGFGIILSMYGGGFATVPAYLADMFGTQFVGAIHGRLLTAWSTAGIIGPVVVNYIREFQLAAGVPRDQLYNTTMYILCAMLIAGLICNYLIKPVDPQMAHERGRGRQAAGGERQVRAQRYQSRLVRHRHSAGSTPRPRCSGPSSASRSPGVSGRRWKARPRSSDRYSRSAGRDDIRPAALSRPSVQFNEQIKGISQCFAPEFVSLPCCLSPARCIRPRPKPPRAAPAATTRPPPPSLQG